MVVQGTPNPARSTRTLPSRQKPHLSDPRFVSGSEASAIAMLTALHLSTAEKIGAIGLLVAAASGIGGGLASVISPAKLQNAAASIDRIGDEAQVFRVTFVISIAITAVCAVMTLIWAF